MLSNLLKFIKYLRLGWAGSINEAGYTATPVACGWAVMEKGIWAATVS